MGRVARPARGTPAAVESALREVELDAELDAPFDTLSAGQRQRGALARALAQLAGDDVPLAAQAIVADEPISAMDPRHAVASMELLRAQARRGRCVVAVLHDLTAAARFADDALVLDAEGRVAASGPAVDVLVPGVLRGVYGIGFERLGGGRGEDSALVPTSPGR
jgi:iron complex transport system ATP-binding protein